jgi:sterol desaturase/sphingolipid hydroxylase (fatty acid hydroxylase superfamily)
MWTNTILFISGFITWTFLEYVIHRFLGHRKKGRNIVKLEHGQHHAKANYFAPLVKKISLALVVLLVLTFLVGLIFQNIHNGFAFSFGLVSMYVIYEIAHRRFHLKAPIVRYGMKMRKSHFYHHFTNPKKNHGVTTVFWDRVFGTFEEAGKIYMPQKFALPWVIDENFQIKDRYSEVFVLMKK